MAKAHKKSKETVMLLAVFKNGEKQVIVVPVYFDRGRPFMIDGPTGKTGTRKGGSKVFLDASALKKCGQPESRANYFYIGEARFRNPPW